MKRRLKTVLLCLGAAIGICLTVWPLVEISASERASSTVMADYRQDTAKMPDETAQEILAAADAYNAALASAVTDTLQTPDGYEDQLWLTDSGMMGYVRIPRIGIELPIYHGTSSKVLSEGVGHLPQTSLPVGGDGTHAALSAHSGMSGARMFTDLEQLAVGDLFYIQVLDRELTYQVDNIITVLPQDTSPLEIQPGKDLCTLITCTPYGINTHRLLVQGHRVTAEPEATMPTQGDAPQEPSVWTQKYLLYILAGAAAGFTFGGIYLAILKIKAKKRER